MYICYIWNMCFYIYMKNDFLSNVYCVSILWQAQSKCPEIGSLPSSVSDLLREIGAFAHRIMAHRYKDHNQGVRGVKLTKRDGGCGSGNGKSVWESQESYNNVTVIRCLKKWGVSLETRARKACLAEKIAYVKGAQRWWEQE